MNDSSSIYSLDTMNNGLSLQSDKVTSREKRWPQPVAFMPPNSQPWIAIANYLRSLAVQLLYTLRESCILLFPIVGHVCAVATANLLFSHLLCWVLELCMVVDALFIKRGESMFRHLCLRATYQSSWVNFGFIDVTLAIERIGEHGPRLPNTPEII
jgi:hypothetical protein